MPDEKSGIVPKVVELKKAGLDPVMIIIITVLSTPGIWQQFFDDTSDKALAAIEAAYPALKKDLDETKEQEKKQAEINLKLLSEVQALKMALSMAHVIPTDSESDMPAKSAEAVGGNDAAEALLPPSELFSPTRASECEGGGGAVAEAPAASEAPLEAAMEPTSMSLEDLIQNQQQAPDRAKLPSLDDLMGEKQ